MATEVKETNNLRQKVWGIFTHPYIIYSGENHISLQLYAPSLGVSSGNNYSQVQGGEPWMLFKTETSFTLAREVVKKLMDEGFAKKDIMVTEIVPFDHVITPLS